MFEASESVVLPRPPADVYAFLANVENDVKFRKDILESRWTSPPGSTPVGRTFEHTLRFMGRSVQKARIGRVEPGKLIEVEYLTGGVRPVYTMTVEPAPGNSTRVTHTARVKIHGWLRLMEPMMPREAKKRLSRDYAFLKAEMEAGRLP